MDTKTGSTICQTLNDPTSSVPSKIREFIRIYNGDTSLDNPVTWNVSKEDWQRFEFLGDRVINLIVANMLFCRVPPQREGEMTKMMGVVSNDSLAEIAKRCGIDDTWLIPQQIGQQKAYGDTIKGGAIEACIGAMYAYTGYEATSTFVHQLMAGEIDHYDPAKNYIGRLQEQYQKKGKEIPVYREISRAGPPHKYIFTYGVYDDAGPLGEGTGHTVAEACQEAAKLALEKQFPE